MWTISDKQMASITESLVKQVDEIKENAASKELTAANNMATSGSQNSNSTGGNQQVSESSSMNSETDTIWATEPVLSCELVEVVSITVGTVTPKAEPKILSAVWKETEGNKDVINVLEYEKKCFIEVKTQGMQDDDEIILEIKENKENAEILKSTTLTIKNNEAKTNNTSGNTLSAENGWYGKQLIAYISSDKIENFKGESINVVCCKKHLKQKDKGDFIEEIAIRLCGFGGIQPYNEINADIAKSVKQFQRDYMKVAETGAICIHVLESLDKFMDEHKIDVNQLKCTCNSDGKNILNYATGKNELGSCTGFGNANDRKSNHYIKYAVVKPTETKTKVKKKVSENGVEVEKEIEEVNYETTHTIEQEYSKHVIAFNYKSDGKTEIDHKWIEADKDRKITTTKHIRKVKYDISQSLTDTNYLVYEHPGIHRSLMWAYKALEFYLEKEYKDSANKFTINKISSGYRCRNQDTYRLAKGGRTHNHMGTALDIHFDLNGKRTQKTADMNTIRKDICNKCLGASLGWLDKKLGLELTQHGATTWIHIDCREFRRYKADKFFKETENDINGGKLIDIIESMDEGKFKSIIEQE